jgi:hypothetical protein
MNNIKRVKSKHKKKPPKKTHIKKFFKKKKKKKKKKKRGFSLQLKNLNEHDFTNRKG